MEKGKRYFSKMDKGLEVHVDADFSGDWYKEYSESTDTAISRHTISYKGYPIVCKSSLQAEITLSSA